MNILEKLFCLRPGKRSGGGASVCAMDVRPAGELETIRELHGSAFNAAIQGELNAEEYLHLEIDDDE